jgi:hypothetical protein
VAEPPTTSWTDRHAAALERYDAADKRAWAAPADPAAEWARTEALGDVTAVERAMATEFILLLRKADQHSGLALRALLTEVMRDVIDGAVDEIRTDVEDLADAVAALEQARGRRAVSA